MKNKIIRDSSGSQHQIAPALPALSEAAAICTCRRLQLGVLARGRGGREADTFARDALLHLPLKHVKARETALRASEEQSKHLIFRAEVRQDTCVWQITLHALARTV